MPIEQTPGPAEVYGRLWGAPGPFGLSDESALRAFGTGAGLEPGAIFDVDSHWEYPDFANTLRGLKSAPEGKRGETARRENYVGTTIRSARGRTV